MPPVHVIGGGLAGSEAAWQLAERGHDVVVHEMRPVRGTEAHKTDRLAELVCSNTFKSTETSNAHGLLKAEMRLLGSMILECADAARVPGGSALTVDREIFSAAVHARVTSHPRITVERGEVSDAPVARHRRHRPAHLECARRHDPPSPGTRGPGVLRRHRAHRRPRLDRLRRRLPRLALRQGDDGGRERGRVPQLPDVARAVRGVHRRADRRGSGDGARVRRGAVLRGMHARRGDGAARTRDAALRADEAGRPRRSAHRARGVRRRAAAHGGSRGAGCGTSSDSRRASAIPSSSASSG